MSSSTVGALAGERVIVTGANGFLGAHLVGRLLNDGASVLAVVRPGADLWRLGDAVARVTVVRASLASLASPAILADLGGATVLLHLAAAGTNQAQHDADAVIEANVVGILRVLQAAQQLGVRRTVLAGSGHEYGLGSGFRADALPKPRTVYAGSKAAGAMFAHTYGRQHGIDVVTLRMFSLYGGGQARNFLIPGAALAALAGDPIPLTGGTQLRDYVYVKDAVDAWIRAMVTPGIGGETINVASGLEVRILDLVRELVRVANSSSPINAGELPFAAVEAWRCSGDPARALELLGWRATTPLGEGLQSTIEWFRSHRAEYEAHYPVSTGRT